MTTEQKKKLTREANKRIYRRGWRWWLDARAYRDAGGTRQPLCEPGSDVATKDKARAVDLAVERLAELQDLQHAQGYDGVRKVLTLPEAVKGWLKYLATETELNAKTIQSYAWAATWILTGLPNGLHLHEVTTDHARTLKAKLKKVVSRRTRKKLSSRSRRHVVKTLELLWRWGQLEGAVPHTPNPVRPALIHMPVRGKETPYLEPPEVAAFLQAVLDITGEVTAMCLLVFVWAMTGCRRTAGRGVLVGDVDLEQGVVRFVCNSWRKIKGGKLGHRAVPIWPLLALALRAYATGGAPRRSDLLSPSVSRRGNPTMINDVRDLFRKAQKGAAKILDDANVEHSLHRIRITPRVFRVAYASVRVQTLDKGEPVSDQTVMYEMGHQSRAMLDKVYARVGRGVYRSRKPVVEFRLPDGAVPGEAHFREVLGDEAVDVILGLETPASGDALREVGVEPQLGREG